MAKKRSTEKTQTIRDNPVVSLLQAMGYDGAASVEVVMADQLQSQLVKRELRRCLADEACCMAREMLKTPQWKARIRAAVEVELSGVSTKIATQAAHSVAYGAR